MLGGKGVIELWEKEVIKMSNAIDKVGDLLKEDLREDLMRVYVSRFHLSLKEVEDICSFARVMYVKNRKEVMNDTDKKKRK